MWREELFKRLFSFTPGRKSRVCSRGAGEWVGGRGATLPRLCLMSVMAKSEQLFSKGEKQQGEELFIHFLVHIIALFAALFCCKPCARCEGAWLLCVCVCVGGGGFLFSYLRRFLKEKQLPPGRVVEIYPFVYITISSIFPLPSKQQGSRHLG